MPKKIPGVLPPPVKTEVDGKIRDLNALSKPELLDLRNRQQKLLHNRSFISKLPDKGTKIIAFSEKIEEFIKAKDEEDTTREMFEKLNLNPLDQDTVQSIEWKGKMEPSSRAYLDSDDDSEPEDVLSVLSQQTARERKLKVIKDDKVLITSKDLEEIYPSDQIAHVKYLIDKTSNPNKNVKGQFKPYKTTKTDVHDPAKEAGRKKHKNWEVTAATPPPIKHGPVKVLSIEESVRLQTAQNNQMRELETRRATERLMLRMGVQMGPAPVSVVTSAEYRDASDDEGDSDAERAEGSDNEVHDEDFDRGGVVFTVMK